MIDKLVSKNNAYVLLKGGFSVNSFDNYGSLSRQNLNSMNVGNRVEIYKRKKPSLDFVLWNQLTKIILVGIALGVTVDRDGILNVSRCPKNSLRKF